MQIIRSLFSSKKFLAMLSGVIGLVALKLFKITLDPATVAEIVGLIAVFIGAQGVADSGKEAAKINAVSAGAFAPVPGATSAVSGMAADVNKSS